MYKIGPLEREKIAQIQDIPSRARLAQVSKEWRDAVETTWGPAVYNLPFCHRQPVGAPDWKKACRLRHMAASLRPEDVDEKCMQMALVAAQVDGRAGKVSGETFVLKNLVVLGFYEDALRYLDMYPVVLHADAAVIGEAGADAPVDLGARRVCAEEALEHLLAHARTCAHLGHLAERLLAYCDEGFSANLILRAGQARNPALHIAVSGSKGVHSADSVYAGLRDAIAREDLRALKACLLVYKKLGRPPLGPLLNVPGFNRDTTPILRALFEAGVTGAPCNPASDWSIATLLEPKTEEAAHFRALFQDQTDRRGATWMHHLLARRGAGNQALARVLCAAGASLFARNHDGKTPLSAARNGWSHTDCIATLIKSSVGPWPQGFEEVRSGQKHAAKSYWTAALQDSPVGAVELLRCAAVFGDAACVRLALQHAEARNDVDIALTCAMHGEHQDIIAILLNHGAGYVHGLALERLPAGVVRDLVRTRIPLENVLRSASPQQIRVLCDLHTPDHPLVDWNNASLPEAMLRSGNFEEARAFFLRCERMPLPAEKLLEELLWLPIGPDGTTYDFFKQQKFSLEMLDRYPLPLAPDTAFAAEVLNVRLAEANNLGMLGQLKTVWREHRPEGRAAPRVSALACAAFLDLAAGLDNNLTKSLADRGLRLLPDEEPIFAAWLKRTMRSGWLSSQGHELTLALVRGGLQPGHRDRSGRTLLHLSRYADIYDGFVAAGADPGTMDYSEQTAERPTRLLHGSE